MANIFKILDFKMLTMCTYVVGMCVIIYFCAYVSTKNNTI